MDTADKLAYSVAEAVELTPLSRTAVFDLIASGQLRSVKVGRRRVIPADALRALVEGRPDAPAA